MAGIINTGTSPKLLWPGLAKLWGLSYKEYTPQWKELYETVKSTQAYEEYQGMVGFGTAPQKVEGQSIEFDSMAQGYTTRLTNSTYGLGFVITKEAQKDNLYMKVAADMIPQLRRALHLTKENLGASLFNNAFAGTTMSDGSPLISATHANISGGTWSNQLSTAAALSELAIEDLVIQMSLAVDDRGNLIDLKPRKLAIHPSNRFNADRILKSVYQSNSQSNNINVLYARNTIPEGFVVNPYFNIATAWYVLSQMPTRTGLMYQEREALEFGQDNDFTTSNHMYKAEERYVFGGADSRAVWGTIGA